MCCAPAYQQRMALDDQRATCCASMQRSNKQTRTRADTAHGHLLRNRSRLRAAACATLRGMVAKKIVVWRSERVIIALISSAHNKRAASRCSRGA